MPYQSDRADEADKGVSGAEHCLLARVINISVAICPLPFTFSKYPGHLGSRPIRRPVQGICSVMADPLALTVEISTVLSRQVKELHKSNLSNDALSLSQVRESGRKAEVVLDTSRQKFQVWIKTWIENVRDPKISAEELWGREGWVDIQSLLGTVRETAHRVDSEVAKRDDASTRSGWKRALRGSLTRKNQTFTMSPPLLELTIQLGRSIDELWTYSEVAFDSLHGIFAHQIGPPLRDKLLAKSLDARTGSLALYGTCSQSKADYSLEVDLFGQSNKTRGAFHKQSSIFSTTPPRLFYHLFAHDRGEPKNINEITIESMSKPGEQDLANSGIVEFDIRKTDLAAHDSWPLLKPGVITIQPNTAYAPSYFRITTPPSATRLDGDESLAQLLYKERFGSALEEERPLSQETKVHLAFKVVECGLYLLGTPWLASLSSKRLRRVKTNGRTHFVLEVQTLDLEDLYFEDPKALSEHSQLFSIGVVLVEIALSDERNPANIRDPELRKSKILPLVERSMGSLYSGATAFCLQDRRSAPQFDRPEKYKYPEETGWPLYLAELLEDYHAHVFSR